MYGTNIKENNDTSKDKWPQSFCMSTQYPSKVEKAEAKLREVSLTNLTLRSKYVQVNRSTSHFGLL
jgi:hypothetical protein